MNKSLTLWDLATISTDIDRHRSKTVRCESCSERTSTWLYVVKLLLYGIFHVCTPCKDELLRIADPQNTSFVKK